MENNKQELLIERTFNAPRELLYSVWTDPKHLGKWWGPKGMEIAHQSMDLRKGGMYHYGIDMPQGSTMWGKFVFDRVEPSEYLDYVVSFSDENATTQPNIFMPDWPLEVMNHLHFDAVSDTQTKLTMRGYPVNASDKERENFFANEKNVRGGFKGTLDVLDQYLTELQTEQA
jgi:uncharacterized protein YndB with AHSA1/START domain